MPAPDVTALVDRWLDGLRRAGSIVDGVTRPRILAVLLVSLLAGLLVMGPTAGAASAYGPLPVGTDVDYQLGGAVGRPDSVGIIARDRTESPAAGRYNICYVNGFQTQDGEKRFWLGHRGLLLKDHGKLVIDENWGEWLLDVRTPAKRARLAAIVGRWIDGCAADGFQAVEFDNLDSFTRSHKLMTKTQALAFAALLVKRSHLAGLAAGQKNLAGYDGTQIGFDFAVSESCAQYDECNRYVKSYGDQVIMIEYRDVDFAKACDEYGDSHAIVRRDRALSRSYHPQYC